MSSSVAKSAGQEDLASPTLHFAGPWKIGNLGYNVAIIYSGGGAVAQVFGLPQNTQTDDDCLKYPKWAPALARARLIAAAPQLYDALKTLAAECGAEFTLDGEWDNSGQLVAHSTYENALAALAKAEGR